MDGKLDELPPTEQIERDVADALKREIAALLEILREVEWSGGQWIEESEPYCTFCMAMRRKGHTEDCRLGHALHGKFPPISNAEALRADAKARAEQNARDGAPWFAGLSMDEVHAMLVSGRIGRLDGRAVSVPAGYLDWVTSRNERIGQYRHRQSSEEPQRE